MCEFMKGDEVKADLRLSMIRGHIKDVEVAYSPHVVGSCHHGMARPQVADRGTASDKDGSCE